MREADLIVRGRVVEDISSEPLEGIRVVGVATESNTVALVFTGVSDADGYVELSAPASVIAALYGSTVLANAITDTQQIHFSRYIGSTLIDANTETVSLADITTGALPNTLRVDMSGYTAGSYVVSGKVVDEDGAPKSGMVVTLQLVEVGSRTQLGTATTDPNGAYSISYAGDTDSRDGVPGLPLQVIVSDGSEVGRSVVITDPSADQRVDVVIGSEYRGRGEYDRVQAALTPHLNGTILSDLGADDLEILAKRADVYPPHVAFAMQAARLAKSTSVSESTFYALLRERLPTSMAGLLSTPRAAREAALRAAYDDRVLPPPGGTVDAAVAAAMTDLDALVVDAALVAPTGGETNVRALLNTSGLIEARLRTFVEHWVANDEDEDAMWAAVEADSSLTAAMVDDLRFTVEGAALVRGFLPALTELQTQRTATTISTIADLAEWDIAEWTTFVTTTGAPSDLPGADAAAREALYAATLNRIVESIYPTKVLGHRIDRDEPASTAGIAEFIEGNPEFDIRNDMIAAYLDANPGAIPGGYNAQTHANLEVVQRVYSLTPPMHNYDVTQVLLNAGVTSALDVVRMGKTGFVDLVAAGLDGVHPSFTGGELANSIFTQAEFKHGATIALASTYAPQMNTIHVAAVEANLVAATGDGSGQLLDIFGSLDYCACEHCRSVFSPAAYLVDLLVALDTIDPEGQSVVLDELSSRRPDIRAIQLSCANTNTELPYIDLVNEILEDRLSPSGVPVARDTTWSAEELRLFPEHRQLSAYDGAATAVYPWSLPLHVATEELRAYLERIGTPRVDVMRTLQAGDAPASEDIVAEALGMTPFEASVVIGTEPAEKKRVWDLDGSDYGDKLSENIRKLLDVARLELDEFMEVITSPWVVPGAAVSIDYPGEPDEPTCDLDQLQLLNFGDGEADRLHQLLRLARKIGWEWSDLDRAIRKLGGEPEGHSVWANGLVFRPDLGSLVDPERGSPGTATGTTYDTATGARVFGSTSDHIDWPSVGPFVDRPVSVSMWVRCPDWNSAERRIWYAWQSATVPALFLAVNNSASIQFWHQNDGGNSFQRRTTTGVMLDNQWQHIVLTYDGSNDGAGVHIYVDGVEPAYTITNAGSGTPRNGSHGWSIGYSTAPAVSFLGETRDVRVWDRILSPEEVAVVASGIADQRAFYDQWRVTETAVPSSGLVFAPELSTLDDPESGQSGTASDTDYHEYDDARSFVAEVSNCSWPSLGNFDGLPFSFACWVRPDVIGASDILFSIDGTASSDAYHFRFNNSTGRIEFLHVRDGGGTHTRRVSSETLSVHTWSHVAVVFDGSTNGSGIRLYIDGAEATYATTTDGSGGTPRVPDGDWHLGNTSVGGQGFTGRIRRPRAWDRELTAAEVQGLYGADPYTNPVDLDAEFLAWLADLRRVQARLDLSTPEVTALWSSIDTHTPVDGVSIYDQLFLPRSVTPNPAFDLNALRSELVFNPALDPAHYETIRAALNVNDADLQSLASAVLHSPELSLANLSQLYRHAVLAHALGLSITELLQLLAVVPVSPFASPSAALEFLDTLDDIRGTSMTIAQLDYVCRHVFDANGSEHISDSQISELVLGIQAEIAQAETALEQAGVTEAQALTDEIAVIVPRAFSDAFGISPQAATSLTSSTAVLDIGGDTVRDVIADTGTLVGGEPGPEHIEAVVRMHKAATLINGLGIAGDDVPWYFVTGLAPQGLDLRALPIVASADGSSVFERWHAIFKGQDLQSSFSAADNVLRLAAAEADLASATALLVANSDWDADDVAFITGAEHLALTSEADIADPAIVTRIRDAIDLVRRSGVKAETLADWARNVPDEASATAARRALKARHGEAAWPGVIRPVTDALRERQRDALVALLINAGTYADENAIYEDLLVDSQMNACMPTSRIKLAISSVQLFVQRCLMGLESAVSIPALDSGGNVPVIRQWWVWMKNYRLWEANRRVFFYPENWAEPELRDDKTPLFKELEAQLDQGSLAPDEIERAFADYLYGLHEISHLDVVAVYDERSSEVSDVVHVVGRTRSEPKKHFYRSRIDDMYWTPWVPIEHEIASDNVVLAAHNRRLFLIWVVAVEDPDLDKMEDKYAVVPVLYKVFWSERRGGAWSPVRSSESSKARSSEVAAVHKARTVTLVSEGEHLIVDIGNWHELADDVNLEARFVYNDCLDLMEEHPIGGNFPAEKIGLVPTRAIARQQQVSVGEADPSALYLIRSLEHFDATGVAISYPVVLEPGKHKVTLTTQGYLGYAPFAPCVFDNEEHSLYIVPTERELPRGGGWSNYTLVEGIVASAPVFTPGVGAAPAVVDDVVTAVPWHGTVPGTDSLLIANEQVTPSYATSLDSLAILEAGESIVEADALATLGTDPIEIGPSGTYLYPAYRLDPFHHPYTCKLRSELNRHGVAGVLASRDAQLKAQAVVEEGLLPPGSTPDGRPILTSRVDTPYPVDDFDFSTGGAYSVYNWELFFHVPLYIAERLKKEQRFEEAQRWYHYVFNPVAYDDEAGAERYWNIKPFRNEASDGYPDVIQSIFQNDGLNAEFEVLKDFLLSAAHWLMDPFNPHRIARWRRGTYRWVVVRKYLDNLLDWADALFRRDTIESINEATQIYALAAEILGERPVQTPELNPVVENYNGLTGPVLFGGLATLENSFSGAPTPPSSWSGVLQAIPAVDDQLQAQSQTPPAPMWWYFCTPPNDQLLAYWDRVADRLFKIRNCKNIDGIGRTLSLFEPPIDPSLIIKAKAAGLDLADIIADLQAPAPHHRYRVLARQALELCGDVRALGSALLQALERGDAEALQELRSTHEVNVLESVRRSRKAQIEEARASLETIVQQRESATAREDYYFSRERRTPKEESHLKRLRIAMGLNIGAQSTKLLAAVLRATVPALRVGSASNKEIGGQILTDIEEIVSGGLNLASFIVRETAGMQQIHAGYDRRFDDWQFQGRQAQLEQKAIDKQEAAAEIRVDIAEKELDNHDLQIAQAKIVREYLESRFTSQDLHHWLEGEISKLYFQAYKLAYNLAKKAERSLQVEHDVSDIYVTPDHWDGLRKGLLAGERLQMDLRRMDAAYLDLDRRELELTKRISLRQLNPEALVALRENGTCSFVVPEVLFDLDHPGHYRRRIKSVSLSIPAVVGPHTSIGATLSLTDSWVRTSPTPGGAYAETTLIGGVTSGINSIATSTGRADSGVFNLDFRDDKLLPFEGAGAISNWTLTLPNNVRQFDYDTISDVELEIRYTARDGGFRDAVELEIGNMVEAALTNGQLSLLLSGRVAFPVDLEQFLYPASGQTVTTIELPIVLERFTHLMRGADSIQVTNVDVRWKTNGPAVDAIDHATDALASLATVSNVNFTAVDGDTEYSTAAFGSMSVAVTDQPWTLDLNDLVITDPDAIEDLIVIVDFQVDFPTPPAP